MHDATEILKIEELLSWFIDNPKVLAALAAGTYYLVNLFSAQSIRDFDSAFNANADSPKTKAFSVLLPNWYKASTMRKYEMAQNPGKPLERPLSPFVLPSSYANKQLKKLNDLGKTKTTEDKDLSASVTTQKVAQDLRADFPQLNVISQTLHMPLVIPPPKHMGNTIPAAPWGTLYPSTSVSRP